MSTEIFNVITAGHVWQDPARPTERLARCRFRGCPVRWRSGRDRWCSDHTEHAALTEARSAGLWQLGQAEPAPAAHAVELAEVAELGYARGRDVLAPDWSPLVPTFRGAA